jgi:4-methyl-5(b-hydroxyethyl)-thiazole monophosphate biosynthesis
MTKQILIIVYEGVAEWEVVFPLFCIYPSVTYKFAAVKEKKVRGAMGFELEAKYTLTNVNSEEFHAIFIPGGIDPQENRFPRKLGENKKLLSLLRDFADHGKVIAAICGAPLVLGAAGLLKGKRFVCDITEDTRRWLDDGQRLNDLYVVDGRILTGSVRGLIPFSYTLASLLGEEKTAQEIKDIFFAQLERMKNTI